MNKRQKAVLRDIITVIVITTIAAAAMINLKDWINRSEAMRAMEHLGQIVLQYRKTYGSVPPQSYIDKIKEELEGYVRLGEVVYRAQWIDFESPPDAILAYTEKPRSSWLFSKGYVVLRLNGRVEWMDKQKFETLLAQQQSPEEIQMLRKELKRISPPSSDIVFPP
ncbi:MAG: hypothetical protein WAK60_11845 [Sedimentisphaerales bacterium]